MSKTTQTPTDPTAKTVFVRATDGVWRAHGPVRKSPEQAASVARTLARRLGWATVAAAEAPAPSAAAAGDPSPALAVLSPVWKDPGLKTRWDAAAATRSPRTAAEPLTPADLGAEADAL